MKRWRWLIVMPRLGRIERMPAQSRILGQLEVAAPELSRAGREITISPRARTHVEDRQPAGRQGGWSTC